MSFPSEDPTVNHPFVTVICTHCGNSIQVPARCKNRFCEVCTTTRNARTFYRAKELLEQCQVTKTHRLRFVTLTIPHQPDARLQFKDLQASFRRLRQRSFWKKLVRGGVAFYEVKKAPTGRWHVHVHAIVYSKFIPVKLLAREWSQVSKGKIVDVRLMPVRTAIHYVTKYTTKSNLSLADQYVASEALKGARLFTPFGSLHGIPTTLADKRPRECGTCGRSYWLVLPPGCTSAWYFDRLPPWIDVDHYASIERKPPPPPPPQQALDLWVLDRHDAPSI